MYVRIMEPQEALAVEDALDDSYRRQCAELRRELAAIAELDRAEAYRVDGALSMPDWLSFKYGYSEHTARAKTKAAHAARVPPGYRRRPRMGAASVGQGPLARRVRYAGRG